MRIVLVVDDDALCRRTTTRVLERRGYLVIESASAEEALNLLMALQFDVVLVNAQLPGHAGVRLMRELNGERMRLLGQRPRVLGWGSKSLNTQDLSLSSPEDLAADVEELFAD